MNSNFYEDAKGWSCPRELANLILAAAYAAMSAKKTWIENKFSSRFF